MIKESGIVVLNSNEIIDWFNLIIENNRHFERLNISSNDLRNQLVVDYKLK